MFLLSLTLTSSRMDVKWNGSVHQAPPAAACGTTNLNKLIEFLKLTGN